MSLDWLTVAAQIVNFLILIWLLQRFLYGPITRAMDAREASIRQRVDGAAAARSKAEREAETLLQQRQAFENQRAEALEGVKVEVQALRHQLEQQMRSEMEARRQRWLGELESEQGEYISNLRRSATSYFLTLSREALGGLAHKTLNEAIAEGFADRLEDLEPERVSKLRDAARHLKRPIEVASSFPLPANLKRRITAAVHEHVLAERNVDYVAGADDVCGISLRVGGQTVSWSLESYLDRIEHRARDDLNLQAARGEAEVT